MTHLKRLIDEPGSDLDRVLLEAALDDQPPKASLDRTLVALGVGSATAIGAGALGASGAGASLGGAKGLFGAGIVKWLGGALIASAAVGGILITQREAQAPQAAVAPQGVVAPQAAPEQAAPALVAQADRTAAARSDLSAEAAPAEGLKAQAVPLDAKPEATPEKSKPAQEPATLQPKASEPKAGVEKPHAAKADKPAPDLTAGGGALSDELRMLDTARKALLAGDNDACLASLAKYSSKFPKGQLLSDAQAMKASCAAKKAAATP